MKKYDDNKFKDFIRFIFNEFISYYTKYYHEYNDGKMYREVIIIHNSELLDKIYSHEFCKNDDLIRSILSDRDDMDYGSIINKTVLINKIMEIIVAYFYRKSTNDDSYIYNTSSVIAMNKIFVILTREDNPDNFYCLPAVLFRIRLNNVITRIKIADEHLRCHIIEYRSNNQVFMEKLFNASLFDRDFVIDKKFDIESLVDRMGKIIFKVLLIYSDKDDGNTYDLDINNDDILDVKFYESQGYRITDDNIRDKIIANSYMLQKVLLSSMYGTMSLK